MERIKEAIKLAKMSRGISNPAAKDIVVQKRQPINGQQEHATEPAAARAIVTLNTSRQHLESERIIAHLSDGGQAAPFEILRTKIIQEMDQKNWKVLVITSPTPGCGKTLTAINLAISMSKLPGRSVYLVDLDLRKPSVAHHLGVQLQHTIGEYAGGEASLDDVCFHIDIAGPQLTIVGNDTTLRNSSEVIASQAIADLFSQLRSRPGQPIIIVDVPPLLVSDDVITLLPISDCSILTVVENVTTNRDIESSEELLSSTNVLGCVLNKSSESAGSYYY